MSTYWPSYADFDVIARQKSSRSTTKYYAGHTAIYVARECFAERQLTREGFQAFVDQTLFMGYADGRGVDEVLTGEVVGKMFALRGDDVAGSCIEPYMYPQNSAEAALGQALVGTMLEPHPFFRNSAASVFRQTASRWFQQPAQEREPFSLWLWDRYDLPPPTQIPNELAVPRSGTLPPNWTSDYQLERQEARIRELESQ